MNLERLTSFLPNQQQTDFPYCPRCGKDVSNFFKLKKRTKCQCCGRALCGDCLYTVEDISKKDIKLCYACYYPYQSNNGKIFQLKTHNPCIPKIIQPFLSDEPMTRQVAFKEFSKLWNTNGIDIDFLLKSGLIPYLFKPLQDLNSSLLISRILMEGLIKNIEIKMFFDSESYNHLFNAIKFLDDKQFLSNSTFIICEILMSCLKNYLFRTHVDINNIKDELNRIQTEYDENYCVFWSERENKLGKYVTMLQNVFITEKNLFGICKLYLNGNDIEKEVLLIAFSLFEQTLKFKPLSTTLDLLQEVMKSLDSISCMIVLPLILVMTTTEELLENVVNFGLIEKITNIISVVQTEQFADIVDVLLAKLSLNDKYYNKLLNNLNLFSHLLKCEREKETISIKLIESMLTYQGTDGRTTTELILTEHIDLLELMLNSGSRDKRDEGVIIFDYLIQLYGSEAYGIMEGRGILNTILELCRLNNCKEVLLYIALTHIYIHSEIKDEFIQFLINNDFICFLCTAIENKQNIRQALPFFVQLVSNKQIQQDIFERHTGNFNRLMVLFSDENMSDFLTFQLLTALTNNPRYSIILIRNILNEEGLLSRLMQLHHAKVPLEYILPFIKNLFHTHCKEKVFLSCTSIFIDSLIEQFPGVNDLSTIPFIELCGAICNHSRYLRNHFISSKYVNETLLEKTMKMLSCYNFTVKTALVRLAIMFIDEDQDYYSLIKAFPNFYIELFKGLDNLPDQPFASAAFDFVRNCLNHKREVENFKKSTIQSKLLMVFNPNALPTISNELLTSSLALIVTLYELDIATFDYSGITTRLFFYLGNVKLNGLSTISQSYLVRTLIYLNAGLRKAFNKTDVLSMLIELTNDTYCVDCATQLLVMLMKDKETFIESLTPEIVSQTLIKNYLTESIHSLFIDHLHSNDKMNKFIINILSTSTVQKSILLSEQKHLSTSLGLLSLVSLTKDNNPSSFISSCVSYSSHMTENDIQNLISLLIKIEAQQLDQLSFSIPFQHIFLKLFSGSQNSLLLFFELIKQSSLCINFIQSLIPLFDNLIQIIIQTSSYFDVLIPFLIFIECRLAITSNAILLNLLFDTLPINISSGVIINHLLVDPSFLPLLILSVDVRALIRSDNFDVQKTILQLLLEGSKNDGKFLTIDFVHDLSVFTTSNLTLFKLYLKTIINHLNHQNIQIILTRDTFLEMFERIMKEKNEEVFDLMTIISNQNRLAKYFELTQLKEVFDLISKKRTENLSEVVVSSLLSISLSIITNSNIDKTEVTALITKYSKNLMMLLKSTIPNIIIVVVSLILLTPESFIPQITESYVEKIVKLSKMNPTQNELRKIVVTFLVMLTKNEEKKKDIMEVKEAVGFSHLLTIETKESIEKIVKSLEISF